MPKRKIKRNPLLRKCFDHKNLKCQQYIDKTVIGFSSIQMIILLLTFMLKKEEVLQNIY